MIHLPKTRVLTALALSAVATSTLAAAPRYVVTDIGTLGGSRSYGSAINASGVVTGATSYYGDSTEVAFVAQPGSSLQALNLAPLGATSSSAAAINAAGQIAGQYLGSDGRRGFIYTPGGGSVELGVYPDPRSPYGFSESRAYGINNNGEIAGVSDRVFDLDSSGFLLPERSTAVGDYLGSALTDIGGLGGPNAAGYAINASGQIAGSADLPGALNDAFVQRAQHAFVFTPFGGIRDLGTLGGLESGAWAINDRGMVAGYSFINDNNNAYDINAFLYTPGQGMVSVAGQDSEAYGINNNGDVVGGDIGNSNAFIYTGGVSYQLSALVTNLAAGDSIDVATSINDAGQITGFATFGGQSHAFRLDPLAASAPGVPEPASWATMLLGFGVTGAAIRRRRAVVQPGFTSRANRDFRGYSIIPNPVRTTSRPVVWSALVAALVSLTAAGHANAGGYVFTSIDIPGAVSTHPSAINNAGEVAGSYDDGHYHGFTWSSGYVTTIDVPGAFSTQAFGINQSGAVVGAAISASQGSIGFVYMGGLFTTFAAPDSTYTGALGIDGAGDIVGEYVTRNLDATSTRHSFIYSGGVMSPIEIPGALETDVVGVNNAGVVFGDYISDAGAFGFTESGGVVTTILEPGQGEDYLTGINQNGAVTGFRYGPNVPHSFVYSGGTYAGVPNGKTARRAYGINDSNEIVGEDYNNVGFADSGDVISTIEPAGETETFVNGINDSGSVLGVSFDRPTGYHAFIANPAAVPEPATWAVILLGFGLAGGVMRRQSGAFLRQTA